MKATRTKKRRERRARNHAQSSHSAILLLPLFGWKCFCVLYETPPKNSRWNFHKIDIVKQASAENINFQRERRDERTFPDELLKRMVQLWVVSPLSLFSLKWPREKKWKSRHFSTPKQLQVKLEAENCSTKTIRHQKWRESFSKTNRKVRNFSSAKGVSPPQRKMKV